MLSSDSFESVQLPNDDTELPDSGVLNCLSSAFVFGLDALLLFSQFAVVPSFFFHLA